MTRKILYSPGFGAGWTTWNSGRVAEIMLDYKPIVEALERGEKMSENHPIVLQMIADIQKELGDVHVCVLGADDLEVYTTGSRVRIEDYDGSESVEEEGSYTGWL